MILTMSLYFWTLPFDSMRPRGSALLEKPSLGGFAGTRRLGGHRPLPSLRQPIPQCTVQTVVEVDILLLGVDIGKVPHMLAQT